MPYYWSHYTSEEYDLVSALAVLGPPKMLAFSVATAQHAVEDFERIRVAGEVTYSRPHVLQVFLAALDDVWRNIRECCTPQQWSFANANQRLERLIVPNIAEIATYTEGELSNAVWQAVTCGQEGGTQRRALLAARNAYNAVGKWSLAKQHPGEVMSVDETIRFEKRDPRCMQELEFQRRCSSVVGEIPDDQLSYESIISACEQAV